MKTLKTIPPGRIIAFGFLALILIGTLLLSLPVSLEEGQSVSLTDALFIATSATCVTGLTPVPIAETFSGFGQSVILVLIQIGGLGVACMGACFALLFGRHMGMKKQQLIREGWNISTSDGLVSFLKFVLIITFGIEALGAVCSTVIFAGQMSFSDAAVSGIFHSISAFNNAGFDILGADSLGAYTHNVPLLLLTAALIILGGLGFIVYYEFLKKRTLKKLSLHTKIVLSTTAFLLIGGTLLLYCTGNLSVLDSFFYSVSARTAGFSTSPLSDFTNAGLFIMILLMFVGASPGSTGGGIKTTTLFTVWVVVKSLVRNKKQQAFRRGFPQEIVSKALLLFITALLLVVCLTLVLCILEPAIGFLDLLFEVVSAIATVGLTTGITPTLCTASKLILVLSMYIGRLGPLTIATIWSVKETSPLSYSQENITIG